MITELFQKNKRPCLYLEKEGQELAAKLGLPFVNSKHMLLLVKNNFLKTKVTISDCMVN